MQNLIGQQRLGASAAGVGIPDFEGFGIPSDDFERIAAGAVANGSNGSTPQLMRAADYLAILESLTA